VSFADVPFWRSFTDAGRSRERHKMLHEKPLPGEPAFGPGRLSKDQLIEIPGMVPSACPAVRFSRPMAVWRSPLLAGVKREAVDSREHILARPREIQAPLAEQPQARGVSGI